MRDLVFVTVTVLSFVIGTACISACRALNQGDRR